MPRAGSVDPEVFRDLFPSHGQAGIITYFGFNGAQILVDAQGPFPVISLFTGVLGLDLGLAEPLPQLSARASSVVESSDSP